MMQLMNTNMDNYYKILGVENFASLDDIKMAHRKLTSRKYFFIFTYDAFCLFKQLTDLTDLVTRYGYRKKG